MRCDEVTNLISSGIDRELPPDQRATLDEHLATCEPCRQTADALALQDAQLLRAFGQRRRAAADVADRVIARLPVPSSKMMHRRSFWAAWSPLLAAAAGFALALVIIRPWKTASDRGPLAINPLTTTTQSKAAPPIAQLALATGRVEVRAPGATGADAWRPLESGGGVEPGAQVRTGPKVRCEFKMADGSEVRLNSDTQVTLQAPRKVEVASGQIFSTVAKAPASANTPQEQFVCRAQPADVSLVALGTAFDLRCPSASDSSPKARLTVVEGSVKVQAKSGDARVCNAGESIDLADGSFGDKQQVHNLMRATQWVDEILVMKGRDNPELARRMNDLFALLGQQKVDFMAESEIRRLGDHCVIPLTRYVQSDISKRPERERSRHTAARIVADVSSTWAIPELINLLSDPDGEVRYHAARALARVTGSPIGRPEEWRDQSLAACEPRIDKWHTWWAENKSRYPGADPDAVKPLDAKSKAGTSEPLRKG